MQRLEVSGVVRLIYRSLGVKGLMILVLGSNSVVTGRNKKTSELIVGVRN